MDRQIPIIVRFSVYVALPGLLINKCTRWHKIAIDCKYCSWALPSMCREPTLALRVPMVGTPDVGSPMHSAGLDRMRHNDAGEPACTGYVSHVFFANVQCVAECWPGNFWESRGRSYSSEDQACKKVFDNRLIVLVKVPRYSFVPRYGFY